MRVGAHCLPDSLLRAPTHRGRYLRRRWSHRRGCAAAVHACLPVRAPVGHSRLRLRLLRDGPGCTDLLRPRLPLPIATPTFAAYASFDPPTATAATDPQPTAAIATTAVAAAGIAPAASVAALAWDMRSRLSRRPCLQRDSLADVLTCGLLCRPRRRRRQHSLWTMDDGRARRSAGRSRCLRLL
jgi:hypothetical protein